MESVEFLNDEYLTVTSDHDLADIQFRKDAKCFVNLETYIRFIKGIERVVRKSPYYDYYVGKDVVNLKGVGNVLAVLESQMGFLALIILPTMIAIIFEIYAIIIEIVELKKEV